MELKPGYKQTDVGVIPEDWEVVSIGSLASFTSGSGISVAALRQQSSDTPVPVYGGNGIAGYTTRPLVQEPVVVVGRVGQKCGEVYLTEGPAWITDNALYPRTIFRMVDIRFLALAMKAAGLNDVKNRNDLPLVTQSILHSVRIPLPPTLAEQEAIVEALSDADTLIESLEQLIAKKRQIKQGAMQELLTGKRRLLGGIRGEQSYRPTKFGMMPIDWKLTPLQQISAFITKGSTPTTYGFAWQHEGVLFLRSECVSERGLDLSQSMFISGEAHQVLRRSEVRAGDILMTITGNVSRVVHLQEGFGEANINQHIARIRIVHEEVAAPFVFHFLSQPVVRRYYNLITTGQAYPQISLAQVRETEVPMPSLAEQTAIATILSDIDAEIAALEEKLAKARQLKQGMMQGLLTGKTRLVESVK
jgi:type I restriction enzyme, S subunit